MKGVKTKTTIEVGDLIKAKGIVYSYEGESGTTDPDTSYSGDDLGIVTAIVGSKVVYKVTTSGQIRNTVSVGSIEYVVNPDYEYVVTTSGSGSDGSKPWWQNAIDAALAIFKGTQASSTTSNTDSGNTDTGSGTGGSGSDGNNGNDPAPTGFFEKYGIFVIVGLLLTGLALLLFGGKKNKPQPQYVQPPQPQYVQPQYTQGQRL